MQSNKIKYIIVKVSGFFSKVVGIVATLFLLNELYRFITSSTSQSWIASSTNFKLTSSVTEAFVIFGMLAIVFVCFGYSIVIDKILEKKILDF